MTTRAFKSILRFEKAGAAYLNLLTDHQREVIRQNEQALAIAVPGARKNGSVGDPGIREWINRSTGLVKRTHKSVASMFLAHVLSLDPTEEAHVYAVLGPYGHNKKALRKNKVVAEPSRYTRGVWGKVTLIGDDGKPFVFVPDESFTGKNFYNPELTRRKKRRDLIRTRPRHLPEGRDE